MLLCDMYFLNLFYCSIVDYNVVLISTYSNMIQLYMYTFFSIFFSIRVYQCDMCFLLNILFVF